MTSWTAIPLVMGASSTNHLFLSWNWDRIPPNEASPLPHLSGETPPYSYSCKSMFMSLLHLQTCLSHFVLFPEYSKHNFNTAWKGSWGVGDSKRLCQPHAIHFWLSKEPIAFQASMVLQSYSSQGKSWSCSGSSLALRKEYEEKHHCHQQLCYSQPMSKGSSSSGSLWGLCIALPS